ncbi:MAG TPA: tetratricopeptide repeat protein [Thermoanaerobaculia bacterium]|nr:tetratricopeptide repeat protein [Thermoanaerobaculia bacterium]
MPRAPRRRTSPATRGAAGPLARRPSRNAWWLLAAALAPLLLYWPVTGYGFMLDDFVLFQTSPSLSDLGSIPQGFLTDVGALRKGAGTIISSYYRPVFLALSTLYYKLAGGDPFGWHLASAVLASLIGALACGLLLRLGLPPPLALLAAIVFSFHPAHVSSIAWASGLQELLAALFVFIALHAILWREDEDRGLLPLGLGALAYGLALLSKEVAIALLPFVAVWAASVAQNDPRLARRLWRAAGVLGAVTLAYLAVRLAVLGGLAVPSPSAPSLRASLPAVPVALATYLRLLLWPAGFAIFRPERPDVAPLAAPVLVAVSVLVCAALLAGWAVRRRREILLPLAWAAVWLLPVLNLWVLDPQWMVTDRYLFLPSLALPWLLALLLPRRLAISFLCVLAVCFAGLTLRYSAIFRDERTFLAAMEKAEPTSPIVFAEKGRLLVRDGKLGAARAALSRAVELDPIAPGALTALGDLELQRGDLEAAESHYRRALVVRPYGSRTFKLLALAAARAGRRDKASSLIDESARRWPDDFQVQLLHALFLATAGQREKAEAAFAAARRLRPRDPALEGGLDAAIARLRPTVLAGD